MDPPSNWHFLGQFQGLESPDGLGKQQQQVIPREACEVIEVTRLGSLHFCYEFSTVHMGVSLNGSTQQQWVFLLKMIILGCEMGVPPFKETPI